MISKILLSWRRKKNSKVNIKWFFTWSQATISPWAFLMFFKKRKKYQNRDLACTESGAKIFIWKRGGWVSFSLGNRLPTIRYCLSLKPSKKNLNSLRKLKDIKKKNRCPYIALNLHFSMIVLIDLLENKVIEQTVRLEID